MDSAPRKVAIIGAGKVARHLALWLKKSGVGVLQVYNRHPEKAETLAVEVGAQAISDPAALNPDIEMAVIAVADDAIAALSDQLPKRDMVVVHTSGTRPLNDLKHHEQRGVFYPLQTFTAQTEIDFQSIPICIEGRTAEIEEILRASCVEWRMQYYRLDSAQRATLHVAAVMANNFTNYLWGKSYDVLREKDIDPAILHPLMLETLRKATQYNPHDVQTGPAVRNDRETIERHLAYLRDDEKLRDIYDRLTQQIIAQHRDGEL